MDVRLGISILIVVTVLISEWNRREYIKTGLMCAVKLYKNELH
jgi:hypothetical protein